MLKTHAISREICFQTLLNPLMPICYLCSPILRTIAAIQHTIQGVQQFFYASISTGKNHNTDAEGEMPESACGFEKSSWRVSLFVIIVAAILGTIQEVIYRKAADGECSARLITNQNKYN